MKLKMFLKPESIAVIGASRDPTKVGHRIFKNLVDFGFQGGLYPINPKADEILGFKCYGNITEVPDNVDLAVIAVPARIVPMIAEQCGLKNVKGIVVISAGFSEIGREGSHLEKKLLAVCRKYGMRMQGPNCLGLINTQSRMNASFAATQPISGNIAFVSQSGALGSTILNWALQNDVGFTSFISLGNEADLSAADFLEALAEDEQTKKSGTTDVGVRAVSSHTGSLAGSDTAFSAAFKKAGVLRVDTLEELFDLVLAFEDQPLPKGKKVLIVTNGGGPGILAADACEKMGLDLPLLELELRESLRKALPPHSSVNNPVDVLGDADENRYNLALDAGLKSKNIDGIIVILTPQAMTPSDKIAQVIAETRKASEKPIIGAFMGLPADSVAIKTLQKNNIPNYVFPESAAYVLKRMYDYNEISRSQREEPPVFKNVDDNKVKHIISKVHREGRLNLTIEEAFKIAEAYNIRVPKAAIAHSRAEAGELASSVGYPVALKVVSPEILHKTDVGGVVLNVRTQEEAEKNYDAVIRKARTLLPQANILGVLVQKMLPSGKEVIIGAVRDLQFGPLMMFGLGGIYVNFLRDVSYCLSPVTRSEAKEMIENTKAYTLLRGVRGEPPSDIDSIVDVILRMSQIMSRFDEIVEMEINPLFVYRKKEGCAAVDIRITIGR